MLLNTRLLFLSLWVWQVSLAFLEMYKCRELPTPCQEQLIFFVCPEPEDDNEDPFASDSYSDSDCDYLYVCCCFDKNISWYQLFC